MKHFTYSELADSLTELYPTFSFRLPNDEKKSLTVYPPGEYDEASGVEVVLSDSKAEFWMNGEQVDTSNSVNDSDAVANVAIALLEIHRMFHEL